MKPQSIRDRITGHRRVKAGDLLAHEHNFRTHPEEQKQALLGLYQEVGFARSLLAYIPDSEMAEAKAFAARLVEQGENSDDAMGQALHRARLKLIDGHLRRDLTPDMVLTVEILDVNDAEASKLLASIDPLAALAEMDGGKLDALLAEVETSSPALQDLLDSLVADNPVDANDAGDLKKIEVKPPPTMTWVLLGLPTVRYGEVSEQIETLAALPGVLCEVTANANGGSS